MYNSPVLNLRITVLVLKKYGTQLVSLRNVPSPRRITSVIKVNIVREAQKEIEVCCIFSTHGEKRNACKLLDVKT
jgi:hypothetical protein